VGGGGGGLGPPRPLSNTMYYTPTRYENTQTRARSSRRAPAQHTCGGWLEQTVDPTDTNGTAGHGTPTGVHTGPCDRAPGGGHTLYRPHTLHTHSNPAPGYQQVHRATERCMGCGQVHRAADRCTPGYRQVHGTASTGVRGYWQVHEAAGRYTRLPPLRGVSSQPSLGRRTTTRFRGHPTPNRPCYMLYAHTEQCFGALV
jgi:hypothetical protein